MKDADDIVVAESPVALRSVQVRLVEAHEIARWVDLMRQHHYLGFGKSAGKRLLHVATLDGEWVALLSWAAAALHVKCRDEWIGWDSVAKAHRLRLVTNNTRFLVLPGWQRKNLASRVLGLSVRRLARDWQASHGYAVTLAETFVDPDRCRGRGTCYRAAGWTAIGMTGGFGHHPHGSYEHHGRPKLMFVYPLRRDSRELLACPLIETGGRCRRQRFMLDVRKLPLAGDDGLLPLLCELPGYVSKRGRRHTQVSLLAIAIYAALSGARSCDGITSYAASLTPEELDRFWVRRRRRPSRWTVRRVLSRVDVETVDRHVSDWLARLHKKGVLGDVRWTHLVGGAQAIPLLSALGRESPEKRRA